VLRSAIQMSDTVSVVICPHCKEETNIPGDFDYIEAGRFTCEHCHTEFLILDDVPVIWEIISTAESNPMTIGKRKRIEKHRNK
jgi:uncharacterized protein YbaR (Trm112 family)